MKILLAAAAAVLLTSGNAVAATDCVFDVAGTTMVLTADCTTDATIVIPDGMALDGAGHTITAVDPPAGGFLGAVVTNGGPSASAVNTRITASSLANTCKAGEARLRGILFEGASGVIAGNTVLGINKGASGCQEGNAIEVRHACETPALPRVAVEISHNTVDAYQKTGIVANCNVDATIHHNKVGASATQQNLAANSVQVGFGAYATVEHNQIAGNQWLGASNFVATAILLFDIAPNSTIAQNNLDGNADVGIYIFADSVVVDNNRVFETGTDGAHGDYGISNRGDYNVVTNNKVRGYDTPYYGVADGGNKTIPSPNASN